MNDTFLENIYKNKTLHTPDVLLCLANLSNDEVFTPPDVANKMLDLLPQELFSDPNAKFLDPACKTGVFLREIAKRLIAGLADKIPDLQTRIDHIFHNQLYGIAITELTGLLSRRSVYCSKSPNGKYSVSRFDTDEGNIRYRRVNHEFINGKCRYCGANTTYDRGEKLETHAYEFIHTTNAEQIFNMKFDVIISNPPYHLSDGSGKGAGAIPLYDKFVIQSAKLNPRYEIMIIPARWYSGGRNLNDFRTKMLNNDSIKILHDFPSSTECFQGVQIEGGVCYFLIDSNYHGECSIYTHISEQISYDKRPLLEKGCDSFLRNNIQVSILKKIRQKSEESFAKLVSANDPFGYDIRQDNSYKRVKPNYKLFKFDNSIKFYYFGWQKDGIGYIDRNSVRKNIDAIDKWKIFITQAYGMGDKFPTQVINKPITVEPDSCCSETYIMVGPFDSKEESDNVKSYITTKFFRFLVMFKKNTQHATQVVYQFVPMQNFSKPWTDKELYKKYNLSQEEVEFIESMIKPME